MTGQTLGITREKEEIRRCKYNLQQRSILYYILFYSETGVIKRVILEKPLDLPFTPREKWSDIMVLYQIQSLMMQHNLVAIAIYAFTIKSRGVYTCN